MWPCSCRNFRPGGRWTMKHPKKDRKGPRQHDLKDDFEPFWTCIFSASDCNSAIEALTESDFMVVECACRQMAQKAGNFSCHKRYLNFGTSTFNLKTQQLYTSPNQIDIGFVVTLELKVLCQKSISSDEKESARRLIAEVDGKAGSRCQNILHNPSTWCAHKPFFSCFGLPCHRYFIIFPICGLLQTIFL